MLWSAGRARGLDSLRRTVQGKRVRSWARRSYCTSVSESFGAYFRRTACDFQLDSLEHAFAKLKTYAFLRRTSRPLQFLVPRRRFACRLARAARAGAGIRDAR